MITYLGGSAIGFEETILCIGEVFAYTDTNEVEVGVGSGISFAVISQNAFDDVLLVAVVSIRNALEIIKIGDCARYCCELTVISLVDVGT